MTNTPVSLDLAFQKNIKASHLSDRIEYSNVRDISSGMFSVPNRDYSATAPVKFTTSEEYHSFPSNWSEVPPERANVKFSANRDSSRSTPDNRLNSGFMGIGSDRGEIDISSELRMAKNTNGKKTSDPYAKDFSELTFQIFDSQMVVPKESDMTRGGEITRW